MNSWRIHISKNIGKLLENADTYDRFHSLCLGLYDKTRELMKSTLEGSRDFAGISPDFPKSTEVEQSFKCLISLEITPLIWWNDFLFIHLCFLKWNMRQIFYFVFYILRNIDVNLKIIKFQSKISYQPVDFDEIQRYTFSGSKVLNTSRAILNENDCSYLSFQEIYLYFYLNKFLTPQPYFLMPHLRLQNMISS